MFLCLGIIKVLQRIENTNALFQFSASQGLSVRIVIFLYYVLNGSEILLLDMTEQVEIRQFCSFGLFCFSSQLLGIHCGLLELYRESSLNTEVYGQDTKKGRSKNFWIEVLPPGCTET